MSSSLAALWALHFSLSLIWVEGTRHLTEARGHAVAVAAFTVYDQQHPCLFSDRSDERRHVFLFPSGQKKAGQSSDSHIQVAGYDLIKLVAWRAQLHKLMSLCGQQDIVDQSLLDSDSQYLKASLKTLSTVMEEYSVEAKKSHPFGNSTLHLVPIEHLRNLVATHPAVVKQSRLGPVLAGLPCQKTGSCPC
ncbi:hypothetical protein ABBQ32_012998 [Trebouxia sp. C0010 RCD-2024]